MSSLVSCLDSIQKFHLYKMSQFFFAVLVTAVAFIEGRFVEVDAVHMTKELLVKPRGHKHRASQLDYFCSTTDTTLKPGI